MAELTMFGKYLRKMRIDNSELLGQMAKRLGVSAAYLSSIENGQREIPESFVENIVQKYNLSDEQKTELEEAQTQAKGAVSVNLGEKKESPNYVETAVMFAKDFSKLSSEQVKMMKELLEKFQREASGENTDDKRVSK